MRLHADDKIARWFEVWLDGKNYDRCLWADEEQGKICVYKTNSYSTEILKGKIILKPKSELKEFLKQYE
ncbi:MAG: hypothetical protein PVG65_00140 [Candidatus Thorarchaeota archaeon]|jgi:hypothetical protein